MSDFKFLKGNIETIILGSLYTGDKYGYEIAKEIREKTNNTYQIKQPTLYSYLKKLESDEMISSYWGDESNGGRRKYYKLTNLGLENYEKFTAEWKYHKSVLDTLVTDDDNISKATQSDVTPLFGAKVKKVRKNTSTSTLIEQQEYQKQLDDLLGNVSNSIENTVDSVIFDEKQISFHDNTPAKEIENETINAFDDNVVEQDAQYQNEDNSAINDVENDSPAVFYDKFERKAQELLERQAQNRSIENNTSIDDNTQSKYLGNLIDEEETNTEKNYRHIIRDVLGSQLEDESLHIQPKKIIDEDKEYTLASPVGLENVAQSFSEQGIRIKIYNKETSTYRPQAMLYKNKILCATSWLTYFTLSLEILILWLCSMKTLPITTVALIWIVSSIAPIVISIIYLINPAKKCKPRFDFKYHLVNTIIAFGLLLIFIFAINVLLLRIVFTDTLSILTQIAIPCIISINIPMFVVYYKVIYKTMLI